MRCLPRSGRPEGARSSCSHRRNTCPFGATATRVMRAPLHWLAVSSTVLSTKVVPVSTLRRSNRAIVVGLLLLVFAVFGRSILFDFSGFDDFLHIVDNPYFHPI